MIAARLPVRTEESVLIESRALSATAHLATPDCCARETLMSASLLPVSTGSVLMRRICTAVCVTQGTRVPTVNLTSMSALQIPV